MSLVYWANGRYLPSALADINYLLRDFRTDEIKVIDPELVDLLFALRLQLEVGGAMEVMSGYRSPQTNAMLRRETRGVAKNSMHLYGKAVDIRIRGLGPREIARCAWNMQRGGVGLYRGANFVHLDTGDVRSWGV